MRYETKRLILKPFTKEGITDEYLSWFQNEDVTKYNSHGLGTYIRTDAEKYLEENSNDIIFCVQIYDGINRHIGNVSLQNIHNLNRSAEFACIFGETDYWNKGYATESLKILINHGFKKMNLNRIWSGTGATNKGMQKVFDKLGMKPEGKFRQGVFLNGQYEDVYCYSILRKEWKVF